MRSRSSPLARHEPPLRRPGRARRAPARDDEPQRRTSAAPAWGAPSRSARALAAALAVLLALVTFAVVSRQWQRAAPPPPARPTSVEAKLVATPAAPRPAR